MAEAKYQPRFKKDYNDRIRKAMQEQFAYANEMQIPRLDKIVLNIGCGAEAVRDSKKAKSAQEDLTATESATEGSGASLYPGKLKSVRAPGWDQSGAVQRPDVEDRRSNPRPPKPESAPILEPASVPSLNSFTEPPPVDDDVPAMTPVDEHQSGTRIRRHLTAVDQAAKELARAALQAEIEKEEKRALAQHYTPEEGEIPPSSIRITPRNFGCFLPPCAGLL